ncbi:MAG: cytochrome c3 family protein [Deltaproteobacteria bacterium]|nr:cytochrome c3 family protein [Deltaproteobacteria bacterium]
MIKKGAIWVSVFLMSLFMMYPSNAQDRPMMPPELSGEKRPCLDCHRYPNVQTDAGVYASQTFCMECHAKKTCTRSVGKETVSLQVDPASILKGRHQYVACIQCHVDVARSPHTSERGPQCLECHPVHGEGGDIRAPHLQVECQACHSVYKKVERDPATARIGLAHVNEKGGPIGLTDHTLGDVGRADFCNRCHAAGNEVGAPARVLPAKSVICMLCHNTSLSLGNPLFWAAFIIFIVGLLITIRFWFQGKVQGESESLHRKISLTSESIWQVLFSRDFLTMLKTIILDVILQRRLLQESVKRWAIHSLIYLSILFRFSLTVFTFFAYEISPNSTLAMALINKNNGFVAFVHDLTGAFIILGILWALVQRVIVKPPHVISEIKDNLALTIIGVLVVLGFLLEGARILMTGIPAHVSLYAFIGYPVSRFLALFGDDWTHVYPYLWYAHAGVGALLVAYLPFGKMRHMFNTPLTLVLNYKMK